MRTIWKFRIDITDSQNVKMPQGARILTAQFQGANCLCLWATVDPDKPLENRLIAIRGTGHPIIDIDGVGHAYIGTVQHCGGQLVWHVFELVQEGKR